MRTTAGLAGGILAAALVVVGGAGRAFAQQNGGAPAKDSKEEAKKKAELEKEEAKKRGEAIQALNVELLKARPDLKPPILEKLGDIADLRAVLILRGHVAGYEVQGVPTMTQMVRLAAAKALGKQKDPDDPRVAAAAAAGLMDAIDNDRFNKKEKEGRDVIRGCLESIGNLQERSAFKFLKGMLNHADNYIAADGIGALEKYRDPTMIMQVIEPIINEWLKAENGAKGKQASDIAKERKTVVGEAAGRTLSLLTGQQHDTPFKWQQW
ncbi:MAG: hypothetical protein L0216_07975, partial [Planctomycetales bacterium]|nr:hypothetical protein [Planctomycetales bacterium]